MKLQMKIKKEKNTRKKKRKVKKATQVFKDDSNLILLRLVNLIVGFYLFIKSNEQYSWKDCSVFTLFLVLYLD